MLETNRCLLAPLAEQDFDNMLALRSNAEVRRYLGGPVEKETIAIQFAEMCVACPPLYYWSVRLKGTETFIGVISLDPHHNGIDSEVSYEFLPAYWGQGYAKETVAATITFAFQELGLEHLLAETQTANQASIRLLEKLGMSCQQTVARFGAEQSIYRISNPAKDPILIESKAATFIHVGRRVFPNTNLQIRAFQHLAIIGNNGSGKTTLAQAICGRLPCVAGKTQHHIPYDKIVFVAFQSSLKLWDNTTDSYLQQRFNSFDADQAPLVQDYFWPIVPPNDKAQELLQAFGAQDLLHKRSIQLSNGELRKIELIKALSSSPDVLIIDNAFVGLDVQSRKILNQVLEQISTTCTLILLCLPQEDLPTFITKRYYCQSLRLSEKEPPQRISTPQTPPPYLQQQTQRSSAHILVDLKNIRIAYGDHVLLNQLNWQIKSKEHWALYGPNGSGKSTLLSLIVADNPQAYAQDIQLFGRQKGTGESIWEIKRQLSYISPELHQFSPGGHTVKQILIQDMAWLYPAIDISSVEANAQAWMAWFGLELEWTRLFRSLSSGEQRLILFIRILIYPFLLLVADEPCQGLDVGQISRVKAVFAYLARHSEISSIFVTHRQEELPETTTLRFDMNIANR